MASNRVQNLTPVQLQALATQVVAAVETSTSAYGVSAAQLEALDTANTGLGTANAGVDTAKAAYHSAVQARLAAASTTEVAVASVARSIYAHPGITDAQIAAAGLAPRSASRARLVPRTPVGLVALPQANGDVALTWSRDGNPLGIVFAVEAKVGAGEWTFVTNTTRAKLTLEAYATGEATAFRVFATKNDAVSAPSLAATIYPAGASAAPALKLAA